MLTFRIKFSQYDGRWNFILLGYNTDPKYNINNDGCLLSNQATILEYFGVDTDPQRLNDLYKEKNAFVAGGGDYIWGSLSRIYLQITEKKTDTPAPLTDAQMAEIKSAIDAGYPVVLQIDYNPQTSNLDSHYVTAIGYNPNDENDITIFDPLGATTHSLKDYLGYFFPSARKTINQYVIYSGPLQSATTDNCLLPNTPDNQGKFQDLVHGSTQWDSSVAKYLPGQDPKHTEFSALQAVVAGIQSTATASSNATDTAKADLAKATVQIEGLQEQLANEELQHQNDQKMYLAQIDALKGASKPQDQIVSSYEGRIKALSDQVKGLIQEKQELAKELAAAKTTKQTTNWLISLLAKIFNKSA